MLYSSLVELYEAIAGRSKSLEKTSILSEFLKKLQLEKNKQIIYLLKGRVFPDYDEKEFGISEQLVIKAMSQSFGISTEKIVGDWKILGDLGKVAERISNKKNQTFLHAEKLTADKVLHNLQKLPDIDGKGAIDKKISLISEILSLSTPVEAKYLIRTLLSNLRIGIGDGIIRDAIVSACGKEKADFAEAVQEAYDKSSDFAEVFKSALNNTLDKISLIPNKPVKVMLFPKAEDISDAFRIIGKPAAFEMKYDGFRLLINKHNNEIKLFTRRLDNVTKQFPDILENVKRYVDADSFIIDSEAVGFDQKTKQYRPFQDISQRIRRKYEIEKLVQALPVEIIAFDILYLNGKSLISMPFSNRRALLEKIIKSENKKLILAPQLVTESEKEAEEFFSRAIKEGQEGIMGKSLSAPYKPGARIGYGVKIKPSDKDFDLIIVKAEYGTGKRAGWLTSFTLACRDNSNLVEIGKVSTGLKEKEATGLSFDELTSILKPLAIKESGREIMVKPQIIVTVTYQNIQHSPTYSSGFALRFPRISRIRPDKGITDVATLDEIKKEFKSSVI
ncbi:MAG: ATP-dependent DNA ligase [Nanoarchaeota archaeon]